MTVGQLGLHHRPHAALPIEGHELPSVEPDHSTRLGRRQTTVGPRPLDARNRRQIGPVACHLARGQHIGFARHGDVTSCVLLHWPPRRRK